MDGAGPQAPVLVAGGAFSNAGIAEAVNIAVWDGNKWFGLASGLDGDRVLALAGVFGGPLYAGGTFDTAGGTTAPNIAKWDGTEWTPLGSGVDGSVYAIATLPNGDVVAGGSFVSVGGAPVPGVARWDGTAWHPMGAGLNGIVQALIVLPSGELVAGGGFTASGGTPASRTAKWDGQAWVAMGAGMNGPVKCFTIMPGGVLVAGGDFTSAGGLPASRTATWNGLTWSAMGTRINGSVESLLTMPNGGVRACGFFGFPGDNSYAAGVATWTGTNWDSLGSPAVGVLGPARALQATATGELIVAGDFSRVNYPNGGTSAFNKIARWTGTTWASFTSPLNGTVSSMLRLPNGDIVVTGSFFNADGVSARRVAMLHDGIWSPLGGGISSPFATARCLAASATGRIAVGGSFTMAGATAAAGLAEWDGVQWTAAATSIEADPASVNDPTFEAVAYLPDGSIVASGNFWNIDGVAVRQIARWNGTTWSAMGPAPNGAVWTLRTLANGQLIAGGEFTNIGGVSAARIARWNGASWSALGAGLPSTVLTTLELPGGDLLAGGGTEFVGLLSRWNGTTWTSMSSPNNKPTHALAITSAGQILAGGGPSSTSTTLGPVSRWTGTAWSPIGFGMQGYVLGIAELPNGDFLAGGGFNAVEGSVSSRGFARWPTRGRPTISAHPTGSLSCSNSPPVVSVVASSLQPLRYQWQFLAGPNLWQPLLTGWTATLCGGSVRADAPTRARTAVRVLGCNPTTPVSVRCVISNSCGDSISREVALTICAADYDCSGGLSVQDIFDFLNSWFAGDPHADFNGNGLTVEDIFDFLNAWFGGC